MIKKSRSLFFVPAHIEKFLEKSIELEADIIILDLEDPKKNFPMSVIEGLTTSVSVLE